MAEPWTCYTHLWFCSRRHWHAGTGIQVATIVIVSCFDSLCTSMDSYNSLAWGGRPFLAVHQHTHRPQVNAPIMKDKEQSTPLFNNPRLETQATSRHVVPLFLVICAMIVVVVLLMNQ